MRARLLSFALLLFSQASSPSAISSLSEKDQPGNDRWSEKKRCAIKDKI